jgi:hypothetical protein
MNYAAHYPDVANSSPKPIPDLNYAFAQTAMSVAAVQLQIFIHPSHYNYSCHICQNST